MAASTVCVLQQLAASNLLQNMNSQIITFTKLINVSYLKAVEYLWMSAGSVLDMIVASSHILFIPRLHQWRGIRVSLQAVSCNYFTVGLHKVTAPSPGFLLQY